MWAGVSRERQGVGCLGMEGEDREPSAILKPHLLT